jgi:hypothetical protein
VQIDRRVGEAPAIGARTEHSVGEVIYEIYNYEIRRDNSTRLLGPLSIRVLAASAVLGPDDAFVAVTDKGLRVHCSALPVLKVAGEANVAHVCLSDQNSDKQFDQWRSPDGPPARRGWAPLKEKVGYTEQSSVETGQIGSGFKYELLYQGLSSGVVSILYREYVDSLARPAFQQDLSYTLQPGAPTEVSFRTVRMTIHSADNNGISYTITRGLNAK